MERLVILVVLLSIADCYSIGSRWSTNNLTWRLINFQNTSTIFEKAFKTWSDVANLPFTQIHSEGSNISIEFIPFDINTGSLAKAYPPDHIKKGVVEIDRNVNWDYRTEKGCEEGKFSLLSVAIHEIGQ